VSRTKKLSFFLNGSGTITQLYRNIHFVYAGFGVALVGQASRLSCIRLLLLFWSTGTVDLPISSH